MKRQFMFGTMLSAALAVGVSAQQAGQPGQPGQAGQSASQAGRTVTVSGCLQAAGSAQAGATTSPEAGAPSEPAAAAGQSRAQSGQFILTNASMSATPGPTGTGTTGSATGTGTGTTGSSTAGTGSTAPRSTAAGANTSYRLTGGETQNLQQFVNSRVEVTGTLAAGDRGSMSSSAPAATPGAPPAAGAPTGAGSATGTGSTGSMAGRTGSEGNLPALRVTSVRQVSGSCTGGESR